MLLTVGISSVFELIVPLYYKKFFDILSSPITKDAAVTLLIKIISIILILNIIKWATYRTSTFINNYFQSGVMADLRRNAFDYLIRHSYNFFSNNFVGSLVQRVNRLARSFERFADRITWNVFPLGIRIIGTAIGLWYVSQVITYIIIVWALVFLLFNFFFSRWKLKYDLQAAEMDSRSTGVLADDITNQNTIQLFTGFKKESANYRSVTEEQKNMTRFTWNLDSILDAVQALLIVGIEFFLFYYAINFWRQGYLTIGAFVLIQTYLIGLVGRLWDFTRVIRDLYQSFADAEEMAQILYLPHDIKDIPTARPLEITKGEIKFAEVSFSFNETRQVLKKLNFTIRPGEKIALIGPSGAGKSTVVKLLFRLYNITDGAILIDNQNIQKVTQDSLRKNLSLVPQDPILFHRTLMENIRYGRPGATDDEVRQAAKLAHCEEFILGLTLDYDTYVGERGIKLSGGERQRIAIARALLKNAPILVLDEATSSLDSHSEVLIQDALSHLMKDKTTIVIAHRLSTIRRMDRILVIDGGEITEEGTHDSLIKNQHSLYKKLWTLQAGGFLLDEDAMETASEENIEPEEDSNPETKNPATETREKNS